MRSISALLRHAACAAVLAVASHASAPSAYAEGEVNIYSYREPGLINPLLAAFTKETGIKTNVVFASNGLIERLAAEGKNSPADLLLTHESGLLLAGRRRRRNAADAFGCHRQGNPGGPAR